MTALLRTYMILGGLLLISACSSPVEIHYFSMEPADWPSVRTVAPVIERNIAVENFGCASALRKQEIILRQGCTSRLQIDSHNQWWAFPNDMLTEALKNYLLHNKTFRHVLIFPSGYHVDYVLEGNVKQFEFQVYSDYWQARVAIHFYLVDREQNKIIWDSGVMQQSERCQPDIHQASKHLCIASTRLFRQFEQKLRRVLAEQATSKQGKPQK